jgi:amino acid permease
MKLNNLLDEQISANDAEFSFEKHEIEKAMREKALSGVKKFINYYYFIVTLNAAFLPAAVGVYFYKPQLLIPVSLVGISSLAMIIKITLQYRFGTRIDLTADTKTMLKQALKFDADVLKFQSRYMLFLLPISFIGAYLFIFILDEGSLQALIDQPIKLVIMLVGVAGMAWLGSNKKFKQELFHLDPVYCKRKEHLEQQLKQLEEEN